MHTYDTFSFCHPDHLSLYISFSLHIFLSAYLSLCISFPLHIFLSTYLSLYISFSLHIFLPIYPSVYISLSLSDHLTLQSPYTFLTLSDIFLNILYNVHLSHSLTIFPYIHISFWLSEYSIFISLPSSFYCFTTVYTYTRTLVQCIQYTCRSFSVTVINLNYKRHTTKKTFQLKQISEHL